MKTLALAFLSVVLFACQEHPEEIVQAVEQSSESGGIVCAQETKGAECSRNDGRLGVCVAPTVCAMACTEHADCPYAGPCRNSICRQGACFFDPLSNGVACEGDDGSGQCNFGKCE